MKELKKAEQLSFKGIMKKNFLRVANSGCPNKKMRLKTTEEVYYRILEEIKGLYSKLPDPASKTVYENYRKGDYTCLVSMHSFLTPSLQFNLICDYDLNCWITYAFHNCPFEQPIMKMILKSCGSSAKEIHHKHGLPTFYAGVMKHQDEIYISVL